MHIKSLASVFMSVWRRVQILIFVILASHVFAFRAHSVTLVTVNAAPSSWAAGRFSYNPESGELLDHGSNQNWVETPTPVQAFGRVPGLNANELEIFTFSVERDAFAQTQVYLVRHGSWFSVLRVGSQSPIAANIGPVQPVDSGINFSVEWFVPLSNPNAQASAQNEEGVYLFMAEALAPDVQGYLADALNLPRPVGGAGALTKILYIVSHTGEVSFFPIRDDLDPDQLTAALTVNPRGGGYLLDLRAEFEDSENVKNTGKVLINLKSGRADLAGGENFLVANRARAIGRLHIPLLSTHRIAGSHNIDDIAPFNGIRVVRFGLPPTVLPGRLPQTALAGDSLPRQLAIRYVTQGRDRARALGLRIRQALSALRGQASAIEMISNMVENTERAARHAVISLNGITGNGKTSIARIVAETLLPGDPNPLFTFSFERNGKKEFLQTLFFNPSPGFVGATSPSPLMSWLLGHSDGGVLLFDELQSAEPEAIEVLLGFLENGQIEMAPTLVKAILTSTYLGQEFAKTGHPLVPFERWPRALREATQDGRLQDVSVTLRLTPKHQIYLASNIGAELYTGDGPSNIRGERIEDQQRLRQINTMFTPDYVRKAYSTRGFPDQFISRIDAIIPLKALLREDHNQVLDALIINMRATQENHFLIGVHLTERALTFFRDSTYSPLRGVKYTIRQLEQWLERNINASSSAGRINPGDQIDIDVLPGAPGESAMLQIRRQGSAEVVDTMPVGPEARGVPRELLVRARERLLPTLKRRILAPEPILKMISDNIIARLEETISNPERRGKPIVIYLDGTTGVGKTALCSAVGEALFEESNSLTRIDMGSINDLDKFNNEFIRPLSAASARNPQYLVTLWDEFPRMAMASRRK